MKNAPAICFLQLLSLTLRAQAPSIPGVPEPGMTIWGAVTSAANGASVTVNSANWTLSDNGAPVTSFTMTSAPPPGAVTKPYVRIITQGAQTYYVMQVPFDSRTIGAGANLATLADPNLQTDSTLRYSSFPIKASGAVYTLTPTINGLVANVKSVDGVAASGTPATFTAPGSSPAFTFSERARVVRVDLSVSATLTTYDKWAAGFFSGYPTANTAEGAQTADADGDGQSNYAEYLAGTNPLDGSSLLRILSLSRAANGTNVTLNWTSEVGRKYQIETSTGLGNGATPWTAIGSQTSAASPITSSTPASSATPSEVHRFYRVKTVP